MTFQPAAAQAEGAVALWEQLTFLGVFVMQRLDKTYSDRHLLLKQSCTFLAPNGMSLLLAMLAAALNSYREKIGR